MWIEESGRTWKVGAASGHSVWANHFTALSMVSTPVPWEFALWYAGHALNDATSCSGS